MLVHLVADELAVAQAQDAVSHVLDGVVVRDDDDGAAVIAVHLLHQFEDLFRRVVVEGAGRLVAQQQARVLHQSAADGATLLLTARYLMRELAAVLPEPQRFQQVVHGKRIARQVLAHLDVLGDRQVGHEVVELEDETELAAAVFHQIVRLEAGDGRVAHADRARIGRLQPAHDVEERRFARARRTEQHAYFALVQLHVYALQHLDARLVFAVSLAQAVHFQIRIVLVQRHVSITLPNG